MDELHLKDLISVEETYWWHVAKRQLLIDLLRKYCPIPANIVEGGIGGAYTLKILKSLGYLVRGFDISPYSVAHAHRLGLKVELHDITEPWVGDSGTVDCIIMQDILEHIADPTVVLKNATVLLKKGGHIILTVPAYPFLMGPWDKMLGHHRRYTKKLLLSQAAKAGLEVVWLSHSNAAIFPFAILVRCFEKITNCSKTAEFPKISPFLNALLILVAKLELWLIKVSPLPIGLSIVGVFQENQDG